MSDRSTALPGSIPRAPAPAPAPMERETTRRRRDGREDRDARASDVSLFQAALHGQRDGGEGAEGEEAASDSNGRGSHRHAAVDDAPSTEVVPNGIFGLFGAAPPPPPSSTDATGADPAARTPARLVAALADAVQVGADGTCVRVQVAAELLPGVQFQVSQEAGRWVVDFDVSRAASAELLEGAGEQMAALLSRRLGRGVEIRVQPPRRVDGGSPALSRRFVHDTPTEPAQGTSA
jgi:hypothetical protein